MNNTNKNLDQDYLEIEILEQFNYGQLSKLQSSLMRTKIAILHAINSASELELFANESKLRGRLHFIDVNLMMVDTALSSKELDVFSEFYSASFCGEFCLN